jgi:hypothetical protein
MKRGPWTVLVLLLVVLLAGGNPVLAKKSGSSFSSGGRSSSRSSSGWSNSTSAPKSSGWSNSTSTPKSSGWSNSSPAPAPKPAAPPSGGGSGTSGATKPATPGGWGNATGASAPSGGDTARRSSSFATSGQTAIQKEASRKAYNDYTGRFAKPDNPVGPSGASPGPAPTRTWDNYGDYRNYRDNYYSGQGWSAPGYAYRSFPSFGLWDAMFLWFMLRQASGPTFMYNHQDDPGVKAFRQEADKLAASNEDLKKQLADLDTKVDQMRRDGVKPDPAAMPKGVDPAVAMAAENVVKEKPDSGGGVGTWVLIIGAGFGVAALFLLSTQRRRRNRR